VAAACHNLAAEPDKRSPGIWLLAYLALAAGFLAKGTPALMAFAPGVLAAAALTRRPHALLRWDHLASATLCGLILTGYLWAIWTAVGPSAFDQPFEEASRRGFVWSTRAVTQTLSKPIVIWATLLPWSLAWFWSVGRPGPEAGKERSTHRLALAGWGFLGTGILAFMAVPTHHTRYYLPLAAAGGIVAACGLARLAARPSRLANRFALGLAALIGLLVIALAVQAETAIPGRVAAAIAGLAALAAVGWLVRARRRHRVALALLAVAAELAPRVPPGETVWAFGPAEPVGEWGSLYFYLDRRVLTIGPDRKLPAPGSFVMVTGENLPELPAHVLAQLELVHRVDHPWQSFLLSRVAEEGSEPRRRLQPPGRALVPATGEAPQGLDG
jgi:4-amino-4-deoxy-L-arabinose transferase-like glycosyltransferase